MLRPKRPSRSRLSSGAFARHPAASCGVKRRIHQFSSMLFFCIRHAESSYNAEGRIQGQSDPPLSPDGEKQAAALADFLARSAFDAIYTSPLRRSAETARPVAEKLRLEMITDRRLMELDVGIFQHKTWA